MRFFKRWFPKAPKQDDPLAFFEEISGADKNYGKADRYIDFRRVFMDGGASSDQCKRVLWQIFEQTRMFASPISEGDPYLTYARVGKQELGRWLLSVMTTQHDPGEAPTKSQNTVGDN